ncbi:MAG: NAD(P)/FAD-dependent oxidoreductase [Anaerolineales bacterium]|nr:NAD(P)/FAD-dependent oxidoreductase [Anaerolineales bacterium]
MTTTISAIQQLGQIGLPMPIQTMASQAWDAIIMGAGHNGLTCAAYLARAGQKVLVLEARERIGGACTLEEPWPGYIVSPCAYLTGLLHPQVIRELDLPAHGFEWMPAAAGMFVPFADGSSIQLWDDDERCDAEIDRFAPKDLAGWQAMSALTRRTRDALRPDSEADLWLNPAPTRAEIEDRLHGDEDAYKLLFEWSMADYVEHFLDDERLHIALLGQGVIGTNASPFDPGTASIAFHHSSGRMEGKPGMWGYVKGGTGMVSFILADIARQAGAVVAAGTPVAAILPGQGVELVGGDRISAPVVISNADPRVTLRLLGDQADAVWQAQVEATPIEGCTVKLSVGLNELPNFLARPGVNEVHHTAQINTPLSKQEWRDSYALARQGHIASRLWTELYFQSAQDRSVVPAGKHVMSAFCQYVPYHFADGDWDSRREEVGQIVINSIGRFCSNLPAAIDHVEVMGPPDIEAKVGLTGGHIFQGSCLPAYMWDRRLTCRTPMAGVYLCGAATHPGGSVIAINGRNAAMQVLQDTR